jgi:hypothetical protein
VINSRDLRCHRRLAHLDELQGPAHVRSVGACSILNVSVTAAALRVQPLSGSRGPPSPRMARGPRPEGSATLGVQALAGALCTSVLAVTRHHEQEPARLDDRPAQRYRLHHEPGQLTGPAAPQRAHRSSPRQEPLQAHQRRAEVRHLLHQTPRPAVAPLLAADQPPAPLPMRKALRTIDITSQNASTTPDCRSKRPENSRQVATT